MKIERFDCGTAFDCGAMYDSDDGEYMLYDAHIAYIAALEAKCAALAAENAALKEEISNITFMRDDDFFGSTQRAQEVMGRLVNVKTPATDAFLAEVRAQGADECVRQLVISGDDDFSDAPNVCAMVAHQLRKGASA